MKLKPLFIAMLSLSLVACVDDGKDGTDGTNGVNGNNGVDGIDGTNGTDGADGTNGTDGADGQDTASQIISLNQQGRYESGIFDESAAEIVAFDQSTNQTFVVNSNSGTIDVLDSSDITAPSLTSSLDIAADLLAASAITDTNTVGGANSVATSNGLMAVAVAADTKTDAGWVVFYKTADLSYVDVVQVGSLPDALTFTPDGGQVVVAIEGEPNKDYSVDPEGQVAVIDVTWDGSVLTKSLTTIGFTDFNQGQARHSELSTKTMVLDGYNASVAQSFEPEYVAISADGSSAYVSLQENNAVAVIDLASKTVDNIFGLGFKNHSIPGNEIDASQKDGVNFQSWPVMGIYMPDTIATMTFNGETYVLTANEGDDRQDWLENVTDQATCESSGYYFDSSDNCVDAFTAKDYYDSDNVKLVDSEGNNVNATNGGFGEDNELRRLKFSFHTTAVMNGSTTEFENIYAYGGRSFSIYNASTGEQVFDSANQFEVITANKYGADFNNDNAENTGQDRSDNKGPEPEALTVGTINGHTYAFIGLERMGGIMVYDVSNPHNPEFVQYINNRDVTVDNTTLEDGGAGDLGPEGIVFVSADNSPSGQPMLIVGNEVSGTTTFYNIDVTLLN